VLVLGLTAALAFAAPACGDDGDDGGDEAGDGAGDADVTITEFQYSDITVSAGDEVVIANESGAEHTFTSEDDAFEEATIPAGEQGTVSAPSEAGEYPFFCEIHPSMQATMTVS
jgi:plastocyanin